MPDVSAEFERAKALLNGSWGEIRVGPGTITRPMHIGVGQRLVLGNGDYIPAVDPSGSFNAGYFWADTDSCLIGSGWGTRVWEHDGRVMYKPKNSAFTVVQPACYNLLVSDIHWKGVAGTNDINDPVAVGLGNSQGGVVERCLFTGLHGEGVALGGGPRDTLVAGPGYNQVVRHCQFVGGSPEDHSTGGVHAAIINVVNAKIHDCIFLRPPGGSAAIDVEPNDDHDVVENFSIYNNTIDLRRNVQNGVTFYGRYPDYMIQGPWMQYDDSQGVYPEGIAVQSRVGVPTGPGTIRGNIIIGGWGRPGDTNVAPMSTNGIRLNGIEGHGVEVSGNTIYNTGSAAMAIDGHHHTIHDNKIYYAIGQSSAVIIYGRHNRVYRNRIALFGGTQGCVLEEKFGPAREESLTGFNEISDNDIGYACRGGTRNADPEVRIVASTSWLGRGDNKNRYSPFDPLESVDPDVQWP